MIIIHYPRPHQIFEQASLKHENVYQLISGKPVLQCHPGLCSSTQFDTIQQALPRERPRNQNLLKVPQTSEHKNYIQVQYPKRAKGFSTSQIVTLKKTGKKCKKQLLSSGPSFCGAVCLEKRRGEIVVFVAGFFWISKRNQIWEFEIRLVFFGKESCSPLLNNFKYISLLGWTFSLFTRVRDITIPSSLPSPPPVDSIGPIFWRQRLAGVCWPRQTSNHRRVAYNCSQAPCLWHAKWQLDLQVW